MISKWITGGILSGLLLVSVSSVGAQDKKMKREEYQALLGEYSERLENAKGQISELKDQIGELKSQLSAIANDISAINVAIRTLVDASESEIRAFGNTLDGMIRQLEGLMSLRPEELFHQRGELDELAAQLDQLKSDKMTALPEMAARVARIEGMLSALLGRLPKQITTSYQVERGDNLWKISQKDEIYADPYMWPRLYRANKEQITDPDLIYPEQNLSVPYGVGENEHLVIRGEFLSQVAAAVYNDASKWHRIYEANKDQIVAPQLIFPAQVLAIPAN